MPRINSINTITKLRLTYIKNIHQSKTKIHNFISKNNYYYNQHINIDNLINEININENKLQILNKHFNNTKNQDIINNNYIQPML